MAAWFLPAWINQGMQRSGAHHVFASDSRSRAHYPDREDAESAHQSSSAIGRCKGSRRRAGPSDGRAAHRCRHPDVEGLHEFGACCRANPADFRRSLPLIRRIASASVDSECGPLRATSSRHASFVLVQVLILLLHLQQVDENQLGMETITSANLPKAGVDYNLQHDTRVHFDDL